MTETMTITRTPSVIALEIKTLHTQALRMVLSYIIEIGRRLVEAKDMMPHGEWGNWLENEVSYSQSTAENYMKIFNEYGADQVGFFGDAKSQTLGNLSYTKALKLLAVPDEEREEFVQEHDVENISTRELEKIIKERDEALNAKAAAEKLLEKVQTDFADAEQSVDDAETELLRLRDELKRLQERPIDVAVMEADPAVIEEAKAEARKAAESELQKKIDNASEAKKKAEDKLAEAAKKHAAELKKLTDELDQVKVSKGNENSEEIRKAAEERDAALKRAETAEKKLAVADPGTAQFKALFEETQGLLNKLIGLIGTAPDEKRAGLKKSLRVLFDTFGGLIKEPAA